MRVEKLNESTKGAANAFSKQKVNEDKGQTHSKRYTTYFNRIKRAIEKGDEKTLQRTKEAIMYAPAKELKNSEASELMGMIKNRTINAPHNKEVNEGIDGWDNRTGVIKRIDKYLYDNPEAIPPKGYIQPGSRAYDDAVSRYGDYVTTPFGNISTDDLMQYARDNKLLNEDYDTTTRYQVEYYTSNNDEEKVVDYIYADSKDDARKQLVAKTKSEGIDHVIITAMIPEEVPASYRDYDLKEAIQPSENIDVATIADYITDHYDFDDIDDKYNCINSIRNSFKDEKTISYEELEQFIGAHNGKDKVNESKHITEARRKASDPKQIEKAEKAMFDSLMNGASNTEWMISDAKMIYGLSYDEATKAFKNAHNKFMLQKYNFDTTDEAEEYIDDMKLTETYWINDKDIMNKVDELSNQLESEGWAHIEDKYTGSKYYAIFRRKGENGGEFKAVKYNYNHAPEIVDLTYDQIMGRVPLDSFDGLRKKLGKRLLPQNENYWFEDDGNFFNKEELVEFGEEIVDHLNEIFNSKWELTGAYEDGKEIEIEVSSDDVGTYVHSVKVDFRKIKKPSDIDKYIMAFVAKFNEQIRKDMMLNESLGGKYAKKILEFAKRSLDNHYDITGILEIVLRYCPEDILKDAWYDKIRFLIDDTDDSDLLDDNDSKLIESASEDIPTETLAGPEEGPKAGLAELISMAIKDEWDAIETYNTLSITARAEGFEDIATISDEIGTEENKHVGQLQAALKTISPNAEAINVGEEEGNNQLEG